MRRWKWGPFALFFARGPGGWGFSLFWLPRKVNKRPHLRAVKEDR